MNWYRKTKYKIAAPIKWRAEDFPEIKKLLQEGKSINEVSNLTGVPWDVIRRMNIKYQWVDFDKKRKEQDSLIASLYLLPPVGKGLSFSKIFQEYGIQSVTIKKALERMGLSRLLRDRLEAWTPDVRSHHSKMMSDKMLNRWKDPEYRKSKSDQMAEMWKQRGGLEGFLLLRPSREKAIEYLNQFYSVLMKNDRDKNKTNSIYRKYKQIIDNHTYPEDIPQEAKY
jgi:hypothetical protein